MNDLTTKFKALSDETRLRILKLLEGGELCVCDIVAGLDMVQPKVSFHLGILKKAKLLKDRKDGKWTHYRIDESDMFNRLLLLSVLERIQKTGSDKDMERLGAALDDRAARERSGEPVCCKPQVKMLKGGRSRQDIVSCLGNIKSTLRNKKGSVKKITR